jgi:hypothetical protein
MLLRWLHCPPNSDTGGLDGVLKGLDKSAGVTNSPLATVSDEIIDVNRSPLKLPPVVHRPGHVKDTQSRVCHEIINVDGSPLKLNLATDRKATTVIDVDNVEFNIDNSLDSVLLRHVYAFDGAGNEFVVNPTDKKGFKGSILKTFTGIEKMDTVKLILSICKHGIVICGLPLC